MEENKERIQTDTCEINIDKLLEIVIELAAINGTLQSIISSAPKYAIQHDMKMRVLSILETQITKLSAVKNKIDTEAVPVVKEETPNDDNA